MPILCFSGDVPDIEDILKSKLSELENSNNANELQQHPKVQHFLQEVWNVHHSGQPLPNAPDENDSDEDIIIAQVCLLEIFCFVYNPKHSLRGY